VMMTRGMRYIEWVHLCVLQGVVQAGTQEV
jgi:hypothetical protein